jgi:hypothetical protein
VLGADTCWGGIKTHELLFDMAARRHETDGTQDRDSFHRRPRIEIVLRTPCSATPATSDPTTSAVALTGSRALGYPHGLTLLEKIKLLSRLVEI